MKKLFMISFMLSLIIICACGLVYATDVNMNLTSNSSIVDNTVYGSDINQNENINSNVNNMDNTNSALDATGSYTPSPDFSVGATAALSSTNLSLSNILNIILIVLGILLVLFAIAILIRMR